MGECTSKVETDTTINTFDFNRYSTYQKLEIRANEIAKSKY